MANAYTHGSAINRSRRITAFHWLCWSVALVLGGFVFVVTRDPRSLVLIPAGAIIGMPLKDDVTLHGRAIATLKARRLRKQHNGVMRAPPLKRKPGEKSRSKIEQVGRVLASVREPNGSTTSLPLLCDPDHSYLTLVLYLGGASTEWVSADHDGKFEMDLDLIIALERALSSTREREVAFTQARMHRPSDTEPGLIYNHKRLNPDIMDAAADGNPTNDPIVAVNATIGTTIHESTDNIHARAGEGTYYAAIRMPWPKRRFFKGPIDLEDYEAFQKSNLWKTIAQVLQAYQNNGITASFNTDEELAAFYALTLNLAELKTMRYYWQRNRELADQLGDTYTGEDLPMPLSIHSDTDGSGYIEVDGTFIAAGYATKLNRPDLPSAFQDDLIQLPVSTFHTFATWADLNLLEGLNGEKRKAWGKELAVRTISNQNPLDNISDPEGDARINQAVAQRKRLAESGGRSSSVFHLFVVLARSADALNTKWSDTVIKLGNVYDVQRVYRPSEIEDVLLAQIGVKIDD